MRQRFLFLTNRQPLLRGIIVLLSTAMLTACTPVRPLPITATEAATVAPTVAPTVAASAPVVQPPVLPTYTNPVFDRDFPDPFVLPVEGGYYAYSTNAAGHNIQVVYSEDLFHWEDAGANGDALPGLPAWTVAGHVWAPSVLKVGSEFVLYYVTENVEAGRQCISYAVSNSPAGPFVDDNDGPFICQLEEGGSIDPEPFVDDDGVTYLLWKSDANALGTDPWIYSQRLSDDGRRLIGEPVRLITRDQDWEEPLIENPSLLLHEGVYYLIYSANWWEGGNYAMGYAICEGPLGPCEKPWDEPFFAMPTNRLGGEIGTGGGSFFRDHEGNLWIAYHAWSSPYAGYASSGQRRLSLARVEFIDEEPLVVRPE